MNATPALLRSDSVEANRSVAPLFPVQADEVTITELRDGCDSLLAALLVLRAVAAVTSSAKSSGPGSQREPPGHTPCHLLPRWRTRSPVALDVTHYQFHNLNLHAESCWGRIVGG